MLLRNCSQSIRLQHCLLLLIQELCTVSCVFPITLQPESPCSKANQLVTVCPTAFCMQWSLPLAAQLCWQQCWSQVTTGLFHWRMSMKYSRFRGFSLNCTWYTASTHITVLEGWSLKWILMAQSYMRLRCSNTEIAGVITVYNVQSGL